jgi:hypothetical protein
LSAGRSWEPCRASPRGPSSTSSTSESANFRPGTGEAQERVRALIEQRANAPQADSAAIARWELADRKGAKPEPTAEALDRRIADAERDRDGLETAVDLALEEKAAYVQKHRDRLVKVAAQQTDEAHQRMRALIDELEQTRATLVELRAAAVWAAVFPDGSVAGEPPTGLIARGLAEPVTATLGLRPPPQMSAGKVLELLRRDADLLRSAATPEQRVLLEGRDPKASGAVWAASDERKVQRHTEIEAARQAYLQEWGHWPNEAQLESFLHERGFNQ